MTTPTRNRRILPGPYDLAVVGGGINGTAIAYDAAQRGKSVVLLEKDDFAQGTSSRSSKMLHGGLRYLEQFRFGLVFEALRERHLLLTLAPHLARAQSFIIPVYADGSRSPRLIRLGLFLYDLLALGRRIGRSKFLEKDEIVRRLPDLLQAGLVGGGLYHDVVMDDARLCLANAMAAAGTDPTGTKVVMRNYAEVLEIKSGSPNYLDIRDRLSGAEQRVLARNVVRALGPWTEAEHLVPSKGVHLVMRRFPMDDGLLVTHSTDGRVFFLIPWSGHTVVGTTETPFRGSVEDLRVEPEEVAYLLDEVRRLFPGLVIRSSDIVGTFAGVRPLARSRPLFGRAATGLGSVSRVHRIVQRGNVLTVFGGKYTTYRRVARQVVDRLFPGTLCRTHRQPLPGGEAGPWESFLETRASESRRYGIVELERLYRRYGARLDEVLRLADDDPSLARPLADGVAETAAEVVHGIRSEFVYYPEDFLKRRTTLRYATDGGLGAYDAIEDLIGQHSSAPPKDLDAARARYFAAVEREDLLRSSAQGAVESPDPSSASRDT